MKNKLVIIHIIQALDVGGCEKQLLQVLPQLNQYEHQIITLNHVGELAPEFIKNGIKVTNIGLNNFFSWSGYRQLRQVLAQEKPDLILTYLFHADMIGRLIIQPFSQWQPIPFLRTTYNTPRYRIARIAEWLTKPLVKHYIANSESVKYFYVDKIGVKTNKITVIPNGVDTKRFNEAQPNLDLASKLAIQPFDTIFICVANLHAGKGHSYLLEAFEMLWQQSQSIQLLIVGDGQEKNNLTRQISNYKSKNAIHFLGRRNDVPSLLKMSDIFVMPTLFEGMSNAILEAMATGLAVITTDIPENKAIVRNHQTGLLVPPLDSRELFKAMDLLIKNKDLRIGLSQAAQFELEQEFSLDKITQRWTDFLIQTLDKR